MLIHLLPSATRNGNRSIAQAKPSQASLPRCRPMVPLSIRHRLHAPGGSAVMKKTRMRITNGVYRQLSDAVVSSLKVSHSPLVPLPAIPSRLRPAFSNRKFQSLAPYDNMKSANGHYALKKWTPRWLEPWPTIPLLAMPQSLPPYLNQLAH